MKLRPSTRSHFRGTRAAIRPLLGSIAALCALATAPLHAGEPLFGISNLGTDIVRFDSTTPGTTFTSSVLGLNGGEMLMGIDFRPATGTLYGFTNQDRLVTLTYAGGVVNAAAVGAAGTVMPASGIIGFDFNPVPDRIRLVTATDLNFRLNPNDGTLTAMDGMLAFAAGDANAGNPTIAGSAYTNNFAGTTTTTLYGIDTALDILVTQNPPNAGTLNTVAPLTLGGLSVNFGTLVGFDISGLSTTAYLLGSVGGTTGLYTVNLATGAVTLVGASVISSTGLAALPLVPLFWDANGSAAGVGGTGNWGATPNVDTNWTYSAAGTGPNFTWPNTALSDAIFTGTPGTVTVTTPLQVRNVTFNTSGYVITGAQPVTLVPGGVFTVTNAADTADIEVALTGAGAFVKEGPGTMDFSGTPNNSYTGGSFINNGVLLLRRVALNGALPGTSVVIGDNAGATNSAEVRLLISLQIGNAVNLLVNRDGLLNLNGVSEDFATLTINGGNAIVDVPIMNGGLSLNGSGIVLTMNGGTLAGPGRVFLNGDVAASGGAVITTGLVLSGVTRTFTVDDSAMDTDLLVAGPIVGGASTDGVIKNGTGLMLLTGASTYTGPTTINAGSFIVDGSTTSADTFVNANGLLGGSGTVGGNVFNRGIVSPGNSTGTLRVSGNYTQFEEGTLRIEIVSKSDFDRLLIGGVATLDGTLQVLNISGFRPKRGDTFRFLTANGGISGDFEEIEQLGFSRLLRFEVEERGNSLFLVAAVGSFASTLEGLSPNQRAVAKSLDRAVLDGEATKIVDYLFDRDLNDIYGDLDRIAPEEFAAIFETSISLATVQSVNLQRRTDDLRSGASGFSASGLAMQGTGPGYSGPISLSTGVAGPSGSEGKESKEMKTVVEDDKRWGAFLTGVGEWVDVDGDGNARGYDITTGGFTLGVDYKVTPNFALGLMAGYAGTGADLTGDGRVFVNGGKLGLYATYFAGGFYVDTAASGGYNSYDTKRSALQGTARGDTEGGEFNALFGTGYDWQIGALKIGPTANVQYTYVAFDDFEEHGSLAPLTIGDEHTESFRTALGFKASYDWRVGGVIVKPELRAAWQHEFADDSYDISASFAESGDNQFTTRGPDIGRDSLLLGAGFAVQISERTATYLYYDAQLGRERYESHSVSGGIRVAF